MRRSCSLDRRCTHRRCSRGAAGTVYNTQTALKRAPASAGGSGKPEGGLLTLKSRLASGLASAEATLLAGHIQSALNDPTPDGDADAAARQLLLCDAVACMATDAAPPPAALVDTARRILEAAGALCCALRIPAFFLSRFPCLAPPCRAEPDAFGATTSV